MGGIKYDGVGNSEPGSSVVCRASVSSHFLNSPVFSRLRADSKLGPTAHFHGLGAKRQTSLLLLFQPVDFDSLFQRLSLKNLQLRKAHVSCRLRSSTLVRRRRTASAAASRPRTVSFSSGRSLQISSKLLLRSTNKSVGARKCQFSLFKLPCFLSAPGRFEIGSNRPFPCVGSQTSNESPPSISASGF